MASAINFWAASVGVVRLEDRAGAVGVACWARPGGERKRAEAKRTQEKERRWAGMVGKV